MKSKIFVIVEKFSSYILCKLLLNMRSKYFVENISKYQIQNILNKLLIEILYAWKNKQLIARNQFSLKYSVL